MTAHDAPRGRRPRVAMLLAKSVAHDVRVMREAETLAGAGYDVRVIYAAADGPPAVEERDGVTYERVDPRAHVRGFWQGHRGRQERALRLWRRVHAALGRPRTLRRLYFGRNLLEHQLYLRVNEAARYHEFWLASRPSLQAFRPDVVHANDVATLWAGRLYARRHGTPLVYDSHELERGSRRRKTRYDRFLAGVVERLGVRRAAAVITVSPLIAAELERLYGVRPRLVLNGPPLEASTLDPPFSLRELCGARDGEKVVVYTGLVIPGRGLEKAVRAFAKLPDGYHLAIVGPRKPAFEATLRAEIAAAGVEGRVHLVDPVAGDLVPAVVGTGDASIIATEKVSRSADLTLPNKLFEAVMAGVPVAASGIRGASGFVREHELGAVYDIEDADSTVRAILEVTERTPPGIADAERLERLRREIAWERQQEVLRGLYDELRPR